MSLITPKWMTANELPAPFVASASTIEFPSFFAYYAFDFTLGTNGYWLTDEKNAGWLKLDLGEGNAQCLAKYSLQANTIPEPDRMPKAWSFEGSNDGETWDILDMRSGETSWGSGEVRYYETAAHQDDAYRFFRIVVFENNGDSYLAIGELRLYDSTELGSHRYWRIYIRDQSWCTIAEIEMRATVGGDDEIGSGTPSASSVYESFVAGNAVDGNTATYWHSLSVGDQWWAYDFGSGVTKQIVQVAITPRQDGYHSQAPASFYLQYSDDGSTWITPDGAAFLTSWANANQQLFAVDAEPEDAQDPPLFDEETGAHRYWRLFCHDLDGSAHYRSVAEIELRSSVGGADQTGSGTASADSEYDGNVAGRAVDNDEDTYWHSNNTIVHWWAYDFGEGVTKALAQIAITPRQDGNYAQTPDQFYLQYSDDGTVWITLLVIITSWPDADTQYFLASNAPTAGGGLFFGHG